MRAMCAAAPICANACTRSIRGRASFVASSIVFCSCSSLRFDLSLTPRGFVRRCRRSARRGGALPALARARSRSGARLFSASPSSAAVTELPASATNRLSRSWCGRSIVDRSRTSRYGDRLSVFPDAAGSARARHGPGPRPTALELLGCRRAPAAGAPRPCAVAVRETIAPRPTRANAASSPNPIRPASSEARRYASTAATSPRVPQPATLRAAAPGRKHVVSDRVR